MDFSFQNLFTSFSFNVIILLSGTLSSYFVFSYFSISGFIFLNKEIKSNFFFALVFYICLEKGH